MDESAGQTELPPIILRGMVFVGQASACLLLNYSGCGEIQKRQPKACPT
jgi:hypothetical protein